jgi:transposase
MYHVGLDVGETRSSIAILNSDGKVFTEMEVIGRWPVLLGKFAQLKLEEPMNVCFEASSGYGYLYEELCKTARHVAVAHPGHLRLIFRSKKKHNRIDALKLAKLSYLEEVPQVHVPAAWVRSWRATIEHRQRILAQRVTTKNRIHALLVSQGQVEKPREVKSLWTKKGIAWLQKLPLGEAEMLRLEILIDDLQDANGKIKRVEKYLAKVADKHPGMALLMTIPGVGIRTAEAFLAYVDDVQRFARVKRVGSYFGLVPCQDATGEKNRLGHITKDGPPTVRKLLTEAAWQGIRHSPTIAAFFERIRHNDPERRKIALIATAHYLVRVMAAILRTGECWHEATAPKKDQEQKDGGIPPTVKSPPLRKTPHA